jgi:probable addiction module antidote protein
MAFKWSYSSWEAIRDLKREILKKRKHIGEIIMPKRTRKYEDGLIESLKDPSEAAAYLNAHLLEEGGDGEELFLLALRDVARANGVGDIAEAASLGRESLYKALSKEGNPKLSTLRSVLKALGLRLAVERNQSRRKAS